MGAGGSGGTEGNTTGKLHITICGAKVKLAKRHNLLFANPNLYVVVNTVESRQRDEDRKKLPKAKPLTKGDLDKVRQLFQRYDKDGSGQISEQELTLVFQTLDPKISTDSIKKMFDAADVNKDKGIDYHEFITWLGQESAPTKTVGVATCAAVTAFRTSSKSSNASPEWNETFVMDISDKEFIYIAVYDYHAMYKDVCLYEWQVNVRNFGKEHRLHLSSAEGEHSTSASTEAEDKSVVELDVLLKPDDMLISQTETCTYMSSLTAGQSTLTEHHLGDEVKIKDFFEHVNREHSMNLKLTDLYSVAYFGWASNRDGPDFTPLEDLADTMYGQQLPQSEGEVDDEFGMGPHLAGRRVMQRTSSIAVWVNEDMQSMLVDSASTLSDLVEQVRQQRGIDLTSGGYKFSQEMTMFGQKAQEWVEVTLSDAEGSEWNKRKLAKKRLYHVLAMAAGSALRFAGDSGFVDVEVPYLATCGNAVNQFGSWSVSLAMASSKKFSACASEPLAASMATSLQQKYMFLFQVTDGSASELPLGVKHGDLAEPLSRGAIVAFAPHAFGKYVPFKAARLPAEVRMALEDDSEDDEKPSTVDSANREHEEKRAEFLTAGDTELEGYFFTKFVAEDQRQKVLAVLRRWNQIHCHLARGFLGAPRTALDHQQLKSFQGLSVSTVRIHNADKGEEDKVTDSECCIS